MFLPRFLFEVAENRGTLSGGPFEGILFYLGPRGTPVLGNSHVLLVSQRSAVLVPSFVPEMLMPLMLRVSRTGDHTFITQKPTFFCRLPKNPMKESFSPSKKSGFGGS